MRKALFAVVLVAAIALIGVLALRWRQDAERERGLQQASAAADDFVQAWERRDWRRLGRQVAGPSRQAAAAHRQMAEALHAVDLHVERGAVRLLAGEATVPVTVALGVQGLGDWDYSSRLAMTTDGDNWSVVWSPSTLHPELGAGERFQLARRWPQRGAILAADGTVLAKGSDDVAIGLRGERVAGRRKVIAALVRHAGARRGEAQRRLRQALAQPDRFVAVTTLPRARFEKVRKRLAPVPGIFFEAHERLRAAAAAAPGQVIGRTGELSAERVRQLGPPYRPGDIGGISGLEASQERRLAGEPSGQIRIVDRHGGVVQVLERFAGEKPRSVRASIDLRVQRAAQSALAGIADPAAMVVVDADNGQVRAVANAPAFGFDRALLGGYPPGSTFKVVTTTALLAADVVTPDTTVTCPRTAAVGGRVFSNAGGEVLGRIPFRTAFYRSCNTAFVQLADRLRTRQLLRAAESLGFNHDYAEQLAVVGGSFPTPADAAEQAAAAIGQGRVTASPLQMASVAAAVAGGTWRPPQFVDGRPPKGRPLPPGDAATIRQLMRLVVRRGTGTAAAVRGQSIRGKTGTAEFGSARPPQTHAWFIGFNDDLAVAVVVEAGGFGGEVAAPAAGRFFRKIGSIGG